MSNLEIRRFLKVPRKSQSMSEFWLFLPSASVFLWAHYSMRDDLSSLSLSPPDRNTRYQGSVWSLKSSGSTESEFPLLLHFPLSTLILLFLLSSPLVCNVSQVEPLIRAWRPSSASSKKGLNQKEEPSHPVSNWDKSFQTLSPMWLQKL